MMNGRIVFSFMIVTVFVSKIMVISSFFLPSSLIMVRRRHSQYRSQFQQQHYQQYQRNKYTPKQQQLKMTLFPIPTSRLNSIVPSTTTKSKSNTNQSSSSQRPPPPFPAQSATFRGQTPIEMYQYFFESISIALLGSFTCYFLSFAIGDILALVGGVVCIFWFLIGPEIKARGKNWELMGGRVVRDVWEDYSNVNEGVDEYRSYDDDDDDDYDYEIDYPKTNNNDTNDYLNSKFGTETKQNGGIYGSYLLGRIGRLAIVSNPSDSSQLEISMNEYCDTYLGRRSAQLEETMVRAVDSVLGNGEGCLLRLTLVDGDDDISSSNNNNKNYYENEDGNDMNKSRELQVHALMRPDYINLQIGMPALCVLLSTEPGFGTLAAMTEVYVPDAKVVRTKSSKYYSSSYNANWGGGKGCYVGDYPYIDREALRRNLKRDIDLPPPSIKKLQYNDNKDGDVYDSEYNGKSGISLSEGLRAEGRGKWSIFETVSVGAQEEDDGDDYYNEYDDNDANDDNDYYDSRSDDDYYVEYDDDSYNNRVNDYDDDLFDDR